ncbi:MAG TPA: hypothetical protein VN703_01140, partial [Candidatus Sulfopaludibacter sp.]|nr:hypothetical protein [Candidatus Sulfopaludibacter sp.]
MKFIECIDRLPDSDGDFFCKDKITNRKKVLFYSKKGGANSLLKVSPNRIEWLDESNEDYDKLKK